VVQPLFLDHLNLALKGLFEIDQQASWEKSAGVRPSFHQQIEIAVLARFIAGERTEYAHAYDSVPAAIARMVSRFAARNSSSVTTPEYVTWNTRVD
jgi:hypothetical protein